MKSLARLHVWWPSIDTEIETVHNCSACQSTQNHQPPTTSHPWVWPSRPWQSIHLDFAGPFWGHMYLLVVDTHSKWIEDVMVTSTTTEKTITELCKLIASFGLREQVVSDNGSRFTCSEFDTFMKFNGIKHILTAPYHPKSNGEAERAVQTFKNSLKAQKMEKGDVQTKLSQFLLCYHNTSNSTTGLTPAELLLKRKVCTRLDLLRPNVAERVSQKQASAKLNNDKKVSARDFELGESIFVENLVKQEQPKWIPGTIIERMGSVMYCVQVGEQIWRRHADQLRAREEINTAVTKKDKQRGDSDINLPIPQWTLLNLQILPVQSLAIAPQILVPHHKVDLKTVTKVCPDTLSVLTNCLTI